MADALARPGGDAGLDRQVAARSPLATVAVFLAALAVVQAIYWGLIQPNLLARPKTGELERITFARIELAELAAPDPALLTAAAWKPVELPYTDCCDPSHLALRLTFTLDAVPATGLGLVNYQQVDNFVVLANGSIVFANGRMEIGRQTFHGQRQTLTRIPAGLLRTGENTIVYITTRQGLPYSDLIPPILAEHDAVRDWSARRFIQRDVGQVVSGSMTFVIGLFALLMIAGARDRAFGVWLLGLGWGWTLYVLYDLVPVPGLGGIGRLTAFFAINLFIPMALLCFMDAWTRRRVPGLWQGALGLYLVYLAWTAWSLNTQPMSAGYDAPASVWNWYMTAMGAAVVARLVWHFVTVRDEPRVWEAAVLSIAGVSAAIDGIGEFLKLPAGGYLLNCAPILLLAMTIAFVQRNFRLFQSSEELAGLLRSRLDAREAELAVAHAREREFVRAEAYNEERRRLMRDMHDGLGSQLMSLLLAARRGQAEPARVAEGLQSVVDEMRLMIDSMDSVGESLGAALATFRERVKPRVEAAGFGFDWSDELDGPLPDYPPRAVLQVFRVLQEAVSNALKHSGGGRISVRLAPGAGQAALVISVSDDGPGVPQSAKAGRGLANMRARAAQIGAEVAFGEGPGGLVRLSLPGQPTAA